MSNGTNLAPALSVLMPAHNAERTILAAVRSTLLSMPKDAELLIFLDACTDGTREVVNAIHDKRLRAIESTTQHGVAAALNVLLTRARGDFIARMDADDICLPWRFRSQLKNIAKSQADIVFGNAVLFGRSLKPLGLMPQFPIRLSTDQGAMALQITNPFVHPSMLGKAESLRALGGYRETPAEDYDMWLRASLAGMRIERNAGYSILYRVHSGQLTQSLDWQKNLETDERLSDLKNQHLEMLQESRNKAAVPLVREEIWDLYSHSSFALVIQNIGIKKHFLSKLAQGKLRFFSRKGPRG